MRTVVGVLVAAVLVVGGCSREPSPGPDDGTLSVRTSDPTVTESSQPTDEPTPHITMPTVESPDDAPMYAEFSEEAALEFLYYFVDVYSYFQATGDVDQWNAVSHPECIFCSDMREAVEGYSGYLHGVEISLSDISVDSLEEDTGVAIIEVILHESDGDLFGEDGTFIEVKKGTEGGNPLKIYLLHDQGQWKTWEVI